MKKKGILVVLLALAMIMSFALTSCGGSGSAEEKTLESWVNESNNESILESITNSEENNEGLKIEVKGNTISYKYDVSVLLDDGVTEEYIKSDSVKQALADALEASKATFGGVAQALEEASGVSGIICNVSYYLGDELIVGQDFTSADVSAASESAEEAE